MARVTIEDCLKVVPNRFELVLLAAAQSRETLYDAMSGTAINNVNIQSLRSIANGEIDIQKLREKMYANHNKNNTFANLTEVEENINKGINIKLEDENVESIQFDNILDD